MSPYRIAIAYQQGLVRAAFRNIVIEVAGTEIAGEACDAVELMELLKNCTPDLVIVDIDILKTRVEMIGQIKELFPAIKIITIHKSKPHLSPALCRGLDGCLSMRNTTVDDLHVAIETIGRGEVPLNIASSCVL
jgi:two-component system invasion response regulator UvrY